jgi:hypothetical protein
MRAALKTVLGVVVFFLTLNLTTAAAADAGHDPKKAVLEYMRLRKAGKPHRESMAIVRTQFGVTDIEINSAASQLSSQGFSAEDQLAGSADRDPSSASTAPAKYCGDKNLSCNQ